MFPQRVHLHLPSGKDKYQTCCGTLLSLLLAVVIGAMIALKVFEVKDFEPTEPPSVTGFIDQVQYFDHKKRGAIGSTESSTPFRIAFGVCLEGWNFGGACVN